jgi:hypothetical protein
MSAQMHKKLINAKDYSGSLFTFRAASKFQTLLTTPSWRKITQLEERKKKRKMSVRHLWRTCLVGHSTVKFGLWTFLRVF